MKEVRWMNVTAVLSTGGCGVWACKRADPISLAGVDKYTAYQFLVGLPRQGT